jgi:ketosteroid isomerase-like protein
MSAERVDLVKQGFEAWNKGDRSWVLEHMTPDVEWITPPTDPEPGHYHGYAGVKKFWDQWAVAVGQLHFEPEEFIDSGDNVVVVAKRSGRGEQSGLEVSDRVVQVFSFEGDKCVKVQEFYDRDSALNVARAEAFGSSG